MERNGCQAISNRVRGVRNRNRREENAPNQCFDEARLGHVQHEM